MRKVLVFSMVAILVLFQMPMLAVADSTMTMEQFAAAVEAAGGVYDGNNVTVRFSPVSGCTVTASGTCSNCGLSNHDTGLLKRVQAPNAQYQLFAGKTNISISNVHFVFVPANFDFHHSWGKNMGNTAQSIPNAELQFLNTGSLTVSGCTFEKTILSPFGITETTTVTDSDFSNIYNAYAMKDVGGVDVKVTGCNFNSCGGGIMLAAPNDKPADEIIIDGNTFINVDTASSAAADKAGTRGMLQIASSAPNVNRDYSEATFSIQGNTVNNNGSDVFTIRNLEDSTETSVITTDSKIEHTSNSTVTHDIEEITICTHGKTMIKDGYICCVGCGKQLEKLPEVSAPKTGDSSNLMLWASLMMLAACGMVIISRKRLSADR